MKQETHYLISDAAKKVSVESHVLRYWEEELKLPIKRNELGHRYYTEDDIHRFQEVKTLKEQGLQLKAIRMVLKDGHLSPFDGQGGQSREIGQSSPIGQSGQIGQSSQIGQGGQIGQNGQIGQGGQIGQAGQGGQIGPGEQDRQMVQPSFSEGGEPEPPRILMVNSSELMASQSSETAVTESKEAKSLRLQQLLQQMIAEAVRTNNKELCDDIKETMLKELDYQFRLQEEREEERVKEQINRDEKHYSRIDELLRNRNKKPKPKREEEGRKGLFKKGS